MELEDDVDRCPAELGRSFGGRFMAVNRAHRGIYGGAGEVLYSMVMYKAN